VVLLGIALGAMLLGCLLLIILLNGYGFSIKVSALIPGTGPGPIGSPSLAFHTLAGLFLY
jgi:hypothetical protein